MAWQYMNLFGGNLGNVKGHDRHNQSTLSGGGRHRHGRYIAHDKDNSTPFCNLVPDVLHNMGIEADSFENRAGELS
jgi:hypothetical protein